MSDIFAGMSYNAEEAVEKDTLGGFKLLDTDVYLMDIKYAYLGKAANSNARSFNIEATDANGNRHREQIWISNKEGGNQYKDKKTSKMEYLPGFLLANSICLLAAGIPLIKATVETKTINVWNSEKKAEVPTDVPMITNVLGKPIKLAIQQTRKNKQVKNDSNVYVNTAEERIEVGIAKAFRFDSNKTEAEIRNKADAKFMDEWLTANKGKVRDQYKKVEGQGNAGAPNGNFAGNGFNPNADTATNGDDPFAMM